MNEQAGAAIAGRGRRVDEARDGARPEIPPEPATIETLLAGALEYFSPELLGFAQRAVALGESQISDSSARGDAAGAAQWDPAHCDRRGVSKP